MKKVMDTNTGTIRCEVCNQKIDIPNQFGSHKTYVICKCGHKRYIGGA